MNEYAIRLVSGAIITAFAFSKADLPTALEAEGISRNEVRGVRLLDRKSPRAEGEQPYVERAIADAA